MRIREQQSNSLPTWKMLGELTTYRSENNITWGLAGFGPRSTGTGREDRAALPAPVLPAGSSHIVRVVIVCIIVLTIITTS